jgi:hypothetical protein
MHTRAWSWVMTKEGKKLENVVYFYYADLCWQAQKSRVFENLTGVFTLWFSDSQTLYLT